MLSVRSPRTSTRCPARGARGGTFLRLPLRYPSLTVSSGTRRCQRIDRLGTPAAASLAAPQEQASPTISLTWADTPGGDSPDQEATRTAPATLPAPAQDAPDTDAPAHPDSVTVAPGDSLWSIAASLRPDVDDARIDATWRAIHAANSESVHDPALIYPGQTLAIPQELP